MNEYFKRTPDWFNYDNAQQSAGDLYDLRVATRDEIKRFENLIIDHKEWSLSVIESADDNTGKINELTNRIVALEEAAQAHVEDIGGNAGKIEEMGDWIKDLERINKIQDGDIDFNHQRILDLIAAGTVDHGKYAHLTELQLSGIIGVLKVYADQGYWSIGRPSWFCGEPDKPWSLAREALRDAGLLEDGE